MDHQKKVDDMIAKDQTGLVCEWNLEVWHSLKIPEIHRKEWNLVLQSYPGRIYLEKNGKFKITPSDGYTTGTIMKYAI